MSAEGENGQSVGHAMPIEFRFKLAAQRSILSVSDWLASGIEMQRDRKRGSADPGVWDFAPDCLRTVPPPGAKETLPTGRLRLDGSSGSATESRGSSGGSSGQMKRLGAQIGNSGNATSDLPSGAHDWAYQ